MLRREASLPIAQAADVEQPEDYPEDDNVLQSKGSWFGGSKKKKKKKKRKGRSDSSSSRILSSRYGLDVLGGGLIVRTVNMILLMCTTLWFAVWVTLAFSDLDKLSPSLYEQLRDLAAPDGPLGEPVQRNESALVGVQGLLLGCEHADVDSAVQQPINAYISGIFFLFGLFCLMLTIRDFAMGTKRASKARNRQSTIVSRQQGGLQSFVQDGPTGQDILPNYNVPTRPASLLVNHALWSLLFTINFLMLGASTFVFHSTNTEDALTLHAATWWFLLVSIFTYSLARFVSLSATNGGPESCCVLDDRCGCTCAVECSPSAGRFGMLTITTTGVAMVVIGNMVIWHNIHVMIGLTKSAQIILGVLAAIGIVSTFLTSCTMSHEIKSARGVGVLALVLGAGAATLLYLDTQPSICDEFSIFQLHAVANVLAATACLASYIFFRGDLRVGFVERSFEQREKIQSLLSSRASVSSSHRSARMTASPLGGGDSMQMMRSTRSAGSLGSNGSAHYAINRVNNTSSMSDRNGRSRSGSIRSNASASSGGSRRSRSRDNNNSSNNINNNNTENISKSNRRATGAALRVSDDSSGSTGSPRRAGEARHHTSSSRSTGSNGSGSRRARSNNRNLQSSSSAPAAPERRREPEQQQVEADVSDTSSVTSGGSRGSRGSRSSDNSSTRLSSGRVRMSAMAPILEAVGEDHHNTSTDAASTSAADGANRLSGDPQVRLARLRERQRALREERAKGMAKNKNDRRNNRGNRSSNNSNTSASSRSSASSGRNGGMRAQRAGGAMSRSSYGSGSSGGGSGGRGRGANANSQVIAHWTCSQCSHADNELQDAECINCRHRRPPLSDMMRVTQQV